MTDRRPGLRLRRNLLTGVVAVIAVLAAGVLALTLVFATVVASLASGPCKAKGAGMSLAWTPVNQVAQGSQTSAAKWKTTSSFAFNSKAIRVDAKLYGRTQDPIFPSGGATLHIARLTDLSGAIQELSTISSPGATPITGANPTTLTLAQQGQVQQAQAPTTMVLHPRLARTVGSGITSINEEVRVTPGDRYVLLTGSDLSQIGPTIVRACR